MNKNIVISLLAFISLYLIYSNWQLIGRNKHLVEQTIQTSSKNTVLKSYINVLNRTLDFFDEQTKSDDLHGVIIRVTDRKGKVWNKDIRLNWNDVELLLPNQSAFSILYPENWSVDSSVFMDDKNHKVAEYSSGLIKLKSSEPCFNKNMYVQARILNHKNVTIGSNAYKGELQISEMMYEGGSPNWTGIWYPNEYCIRLTDNLAFKMNFYENDAEPKNSALYEKILSTIEFEQGTN